MDDGAPRRWRRWLPGCTLPSPAAPRVPALGPPCLCTASARTPPPPLHGPYSLIATPASPPHAGSSACFHPPSRRPLAPQLEQSEESDFVNASRDGGKKVVEIAAGSGGAATTSEETAADRRKSRRASVKGDVSAAHAPVGRPCSPSLSAHAPRPRCRPVCVPRQPMRACCHLPSPPRLAGARRLACTPPLFDLLNLPSSSLRAQASQAPPAA